MKKFFIFVGRILQYQMTLITNCECDVWWIQFFVRWKLRNVSWIVHIQTTFRKRKRINPTTRALARKIRITISLIRQFHLDVAFYFTMGETRLTREQGTLNEITGRGHASRTEMGRHWKKNNFVRSGTWQFQSSNYLDRWDLPTYAILDLEVAASGPDCFRNSIRREEYVKPRVWKLRSVEPLRKEKLFFMLLLIFFPRD